MINEKIFCKYLIKSFRLNQLIEYFNDYVIINWEFASTYTDELQEKMEKLYMGVYGLKIREKLRFLVYCSDETMDMLNGG